MNTLPLTTAVSSTASLPLQRTFSPRRRSARTFAALKVAALSFLCAPLYLPPLQADDASEAKVIDAAKSSVVLWDTQTTQKTQKGQWSAPNATSVATIAEVEVGIPEPQDGQSFGSSDVIRPPFFGIGFYVAKNLIATRYKDTLEGDYKIILKGLDGKIKNTKVRLKSYSKDFQIAILETDAENPTFLPLTTVDTSKEAPIKIFDKNGSVVNGFVRPIGKFFLANEYRVIDVPHRSSGSEGSPVLDNKGHAIGINSVPYGSMWIGKRFVVSSEIIAALKDKNGKWEPKTNDSNKKIALAKKYENVSMVYYHKAGLGDKNLERFSLKNNSDFVIHNISGFMIYRDNEDKILSYRPVVFRLPIPPKFTKMIEEESFLGGKYFNSDNGTIKAEFQVLDYEIMTFFELIQQGFEELP
jgi:hypothetical protein